VGGVSELTAASGPAPNPRGEAMVAELRWVHDMIRQDLAMIQQMAADTAAGEPASTIRRGLRALASASPIWQLKAGCLRHCRFVHSHHSHESYLLFPALRQANPALNLVVDRLQADHEHVATLLGDVEAAAEELAEGTARDRLVQALDTLRTELLAHLAYEEEHIADTLRTFTRWPGW
jgi:hemerythrin HHE cation binding domain-containing protein